MEAFQSHLENTLFKTDQDNFYRVSTVISKLCEEEKIDVIGCKTKANLQPLPRRRAMTVISPGWARCRPVVFRLRCCEVYPISGDYEEAAWLLGLAGGKSF